MYNAWGGGWEGTHYSGCIMPGGGWEGTHYSGCIMPGGGVGGYSL